jgi:hypothetical protein
MQRLYCVVGDGCILRYTKVKCSVAAPWSNKLSSYIFDSDCALEQQRTSVALNLIVADKFWKFRCDLVVFHTVYPRP